MHFGVDRLVDREFQVAGNIPRRSRSIPWSQSTTRFQLAPVGAIKLHNLVCTISGYEAGSQAAEGGSGSSQVSKSRETQGALA
jgi:hypothetical protein